VPGVDRLNRFDRHVPRTVVNRRHLRAAGFHKV
jgi:hypothetical protein